MIFYEHPECVERLIVGRVRLVCQWPVPLDQARKVTSRGPVVLEDRRVTELDTRLHDDGDNAVPSRMESATLEFRASKAKRACNVAGPGHGGRRLASQLSTRDGDFASHDVDRGLRAGRQTGPCLF